MKATELQGLSADALNEQLLGLREEQFRLRVQKTTGQLRQTHLLRQNKRDIARVKTALAQQGPGRDQDQGRASAAGQGQDRASAAGQGQDRASAAGQDHAGAGENDND